MSASIIKIESKAQFDKLVKDTPIVIADFYADWCGPCKAIAPLFQKLAESAANVESVAFVKIDTDALKDIAAQHQVTALPTFMVFKDGKVLEKIQGADPNKLRQTVMRLAGELMTGGGASSSGAAAGSSSGGSGGGSWRGAELPRGYGDVTDQIEIKGCELLNADDDNGNVRVLFEASKPSALSGKEGANDFVESGSDDQLLLFTPFSSMIKLHTLQLTSLPPKDDDDAPMRPGTIHLYTNKPHNLDFAEADDTPPTQAFTLTEADWNADGTANISLRFVKFQNIHSLIIYVTAGDGDGEKVRLDRVRLIGESGEKREMGKLEKIGDEPGE
ncbi:thioredoxin [Plectosphaerella plurivora]|uniref:Thioredoxin n=1 Tax=Plectosphaerella plurivora TaxID=936078 RepID=A0A9P8VH44_9PEZI|nr:thioredoxin [Plectosphaerella plurivora]